MSFLSALTSGNYESLRGTSSIPATYAAAQYMCLGTNTTVLAARVNQATFGNSFAAITFDTVTTGAYTDVKEGMTVLISHTNDKRAAYFVGRARTGTTSTSLKINETSVSPSDNDYIFVLNDYRIYHKLGRETGGVYYKDYGLTFTELKPVIYNLQSAYAGIVSGSPVGYTVVFAALAIAATSGATISTYAWTLPGGTTVTAGSTATANVTVRFDAAASEYWVKLLVTDSGGRTQTRYIPVFAVPADLSTTVVLGFKGAQLTGDIDSGWSGNGEAFANVDTVLDNTLTVVFDVEYYNSVATNINGNVRFVGRFRKESNSTETDETYGQLSSTAFELEGVASQLGRISAPYITAQDSASPTTWDKVRKLTVWRAITYMLEHSTFHELHSLSFDSVSNIFQAYQLEVDQGNVLDSVKSLAQAINANLEFAPTGEVRIARHACFLDSSARTALTTVASLTTLDCTRFNLEREHVETVGLVEASGGTYAFTTMGIVGAAVTALLSIAPGTAQGNAEGTATLTRQILLSDSFKGTAQAELNLRTGNYYAQQNDEISLTVDLLDGYHFLIPSVSQWYKWTIAATDNLRGLVYTTDNRWLLKTIDISHDNDTGTKAVTATFVSETTGVAGQTQTYPISSTTSPTLPDVPTLPGYPNYPPLPEIPFPTTPLPEELPPISTPLPGVPVDGNSVVYWSGEHIWAVRDFLGLNTPFEITPSAITGTIQDFGLVYQTGYLLTNDGTNSVVYYSENVFASDPVWTSTPIISKYSALEPASTSGGVYIYSADDNATTVSVDSTVSGNGNNTGIAITTSDDVRILTNNSLWRINATDYETADGPEGYVPADDPYNYDLILPAATPGALLYRIGTSGAWALAGIDVSFTAASTGTLYLIMNEYLTIAPGFSDNDGSLLSTVQIEGASGLATTRYSSDYAATFGDIRTSGAASFITAPAAIQIGTTALIGSSGQVRKATSGGTWADYGSVTPTGTQPTALLLPRYQFGSTTTGNVTTTTPQYLMGSSVLGASNKALLKVTASGVTFTDITPFVTPDYGLVITNRSLAIPWWSGAKICGVLQFGSLPRLVTSSNSGTSWSDRGVLDTSAKMVVYRKGDTTAQQLFITNGGPAYSPDFGASIITKTYPGDTATEPIIGIAVYG